MADVSAKDGSQETAIGLISLMIGYILTPYLDTFFLVCWEKEEASREENNEIMMNIASCGWFHL